MGFSSCSQYHRNSVTECDRPRCQLLVATYMNCNNCLQNLKIQRLDCHSLACNSLRCRICIADKVDRGIQKFRITTRNLNDFYNVFFNVVHRQIWRTL